MSSGPRAVALAASGAAWEASVVREVEAADGLLLARRCMDVAELLAVAGASADVAVVDAHHPGLDVEAVVTLDRRGVQVIGIGSPERCEALGITHHARPGEVEVVVASAGVPAAAPVTARERPGGDRTGRLVAVWGPQGAPGRSTVALSVAAELADLGDDVVLVDADTYGGSQAQLVALLDDVSGLMAACRVANRGETDEVAGHVVPIGHRLGLLSGLPRADMWPHVRSGALDRVLQALRRSHDTVVVDCGFCLEPAEGGGTGRNAATLRVLQDADVVLAVGRADPVGLARLVRGLPELRAVAGVEPVVVLNQLRPTLGWDERDLVRTLVRLGEGEPAALLPGDADALDEAMMRGEPVRVVAPGSPFVAQVRRLVVETLPGAVPRVASPA